MTDSPTAFFCVAGKMEAKGRWECTNHSGETGGCGHLEIEEEHEEVRLVILRG